MPIRLPIYTSARMLSGEVIKRWVQDCRQRYSPNTLKSYIPTIWRFYSHCAPKYISDLTVEHIEQYLVSLKGLSGKSINTQLIALKSFGTWLEAHDLPNPMKKVKKVPERSKQRVLSVDEYRAVLAVCTPLEADTVQFLGNSGLRADEMLNLTAQSVSDDGKFLHVIGKGQKSRIVPLNRTCREIIGRHPHLNLSKNYLCLYRTCLSLARRAAIHRFSPHALRHLFATQLMRKNVNIYRISKILGHSSVQTTEKCYIHFLARIDLDGVTDVLDKHDSNPELPSSQ